jgi:hypothetical protein
MLLIIVLLNYGTLAKLILAKLASKNRMPGFMRLGVGCKNVPDDISDDNGMMELTLEQKDDMTQWSSH